MGEDDSRIDALVDDVAADALVTGGAIIAVLGLAGALVTGAIALSTGTEFYVAPLIFSVAGCLLGLWARHVGKTRAVGRFGNLLVAVLALLPTLFFVVAHFFTSIGAAAYITGPFIHLYAFTVVATGCFLRPRASVAAGAIGAVGLLCSWSFARVALLEVAAKTPLLQVDLAEPAIWVFKAVVVFAVGGATAATALVARHLVSRVLAEERETQAVSKLFGEFVSADVRDKILKERGGLKSERRTMAVLFSDLRGFTTWSERTDPPSSSPASTSTSKKWSRPSNAKAASSTNSSATLSWPPSAAWCR